MNTTLKKLVISYLFFFTVIYSSYTHSSIFNGVGCDVLTVKTLNTMINETKPQYINNPFNHQRCIPISFKENDVPTLKRSHFENSQALFDVYQDFVLSRDTQVIQARTSNHKVAKFLKINVKSAEFQRFMINVNKTQILKENVKRWMFFHELMHLSERAESISVYLKVKEATADIAAVLMLSITNKMPIHDTLTLIKEITKVRATDYNTGGYHHFNKRSFRNASKNLSLFNKISSTNELNNPDYLSNLIIKIEMLAFDAQDMSVDKFKERYLTKDKNFSSDTVSRNC